MEIETILEIYPYTRNVCSVIDSYITSMRDFEIHRKLFNKVLDEFDFYVNDIPEWLSAYDEYSPNERFQAIYSEF